jgi:predicted transcriptional regulator
MEEKSLSDEKKVLMEERYLPEAEGLLESKTTSMTTNGSIQKEIKLPFCDACGQTLKDQRIAVCSCKKKICPSCMIIHESKIYCRECAKQITSLSKVEFFILYGVANEANLKDIKHASSMNSDILEEALHMMLERGMVEIKGFSIFTHCAITDKGLAVLATCEQIYRNEGDVSRFLLILHEIVSEV